MRSRFLQKWTNHTRVNSSVLVRVPGPDGATWKDGRLPSTQGTGAWGAAWGPWSDWSPWSPPPGTSHPPPCTPLIADAGSAYKVGNERIRSQVKKKKKRSRVERTVALFALVCRRLKGLNFLENCLNTMRSHLPACGYSTPPLGHYSLKITSSWLNIRANVTTHSSVWHPWGNDVLATQQRALCVCVFVLNYE